MTSSTLPGRPNGKRRILTRLSVCLPLQH